MADISVMFCAVCKNKYFHRLQCVLPPFLRHAVVTAQCLNCGYVDSRAE